MDYWTNSNMTELTCKQNIEERLAQPKSIDLAHSYERQGLLSLAAASYQEARDYKKALEIYLRNVDEVAFERAKEDFNFETLKDVLKDEVEISKLETLCGRPYFHTQDEFHSYVSAAECAKKLGDDESFKQYLRTAINIGLDRAPKDKIYYDHIVDCYERLGEVEKAKESREKFAVTQ